MLHGFQTRVLAALCAGCLTPACANAEDARVVYESEMAFFAESPSPFIEQFEQWQDAVDKALSHDPALLDQVRTTNSADPTIAKLVDEPEWLEGIDTFNPYDIEEIPAHQLFSYLPNGPTTLWIAGYDGLIIRSIDDGRTWSRQDSGVTEDLFSVDFVDSKHGWAVGEEGIVLRSVDAGDSWKRLASLPAPGLRAIDCLNRQQCWAIGGGAVYHSTDGGESWQTAGPLRGDLRALHMVSLDEGLAGGFGGIWRTTDGGTSWKVTSDLGMGDPSQRGIFAIDSSGGQIVWAVGVADGSALVMRSDDSGLTWEDQSAALRFPEDSSGEYTIALCVVAVSKTRALIGGTNGFVFATVDGGANWWPQLAAQDETLSIHACAMRDQRVGWMVGNFGHVLGTNTGGLRWVPLRGLYMEYFRGAAEVTGIAPVD